MKSFFENRYVFVSLRFIAKLMLAIEKRVWWHFGIMMPLYRLYWENRYKINSEAIRNLPQNQVIVI